MGVRLPPEYQETEWIEGNRNIQFIDSGIPGNINTLIIEAKVKPGAYVQYCPLWGNYASETHNVTRFISYASNSILSYINTKSGGGTSPVALTLFGTGKTFVIRQERTKLIVDGTEYAISASTSGTENNKNVAINASRPDNPSTSNTSIQRWYYVRMFDGETKLRDFVPCYRKSDDKPGMYDLVTKQFFTNAGTGEFLVGPDVIDSISPLMVAWRRIMMAAASVAKKLVKLIATSTTGLVSFGTNVEMPTKVTCEFSPVQEGTGDPSPDNVRPISGWTGCDITNQNQNWLNLADQSFTRYKEITLDSVIPAGTYTFSVIITSEDTDKTVSTFAFMSAISARLFINSEVARNTRVYKKMVFTEPVGKLRLYASTTLSTSTGDACTWSSMQLTSGESELPYLAQVKTTLPITFTDPSTGDPLTVYGGTVTLNEDGSADVTATWIYGTPNYSMLGARAYSDGDYRNTYNYMGFGAYRGFPDPNNHTKIISDKAVRGSFSTTNTNPIVMQTSDNYIYFGVKSELLESDDLTGLRAYLIEHAPVICYPLKQKDYITYHFDNIGQLQSFLGQNNIWHDMNGNITVEYWNKQ